VRIQIDYATQYSYQHTARSVVQVLRLTPRSNAGQHVVHWRVDSDPEVRLCASEDAFGNAVQTLYVYEPLDRLTLRVSGEVVTTDTSGVLAGTIERLPPEVYLRSTPLTAVDEALADLARDIEAGEGADPLDRLHALLRRLYQSIAFDTGATNATTVGAAAYALRRGVCQDFAHIFIGVARRMGSPARYVSGHLARSDGRVEQDAAHAWAEAHVPGLGWIGFDPANGICASERHVRIGTALDYLGAAPVRGSRVGGGAEHMVVTLKVQEQLQLQC